MITTEATDDLGRIHDRMPMFVEADQVDTWLDPASDPADLRKLLVPALPGMLDAYPVSIAVGNVRNDDPSLVEPIPLGDSLGAGAAASRRRRVVLSRRCRTSSSCRHRPAPRGSSPTSPARPRQTLVLGHGAGGGIQARDLAALAVALPAKRVNVLRVEQPWRVAGGRVAPAPARLDLAWAAIFPGLAP